MKHDNTYLKNIQTKVQNVETRLDILANVIKSKPKELYYYVLQNGAEVRSPQPIAFPPVVPVVERGRVLVSEYVIKREKDA